MYHKYHGLRENQSNSPSVNTAMPTHESAEVDLSIRSQKRALELTNAKQFSEIRRTCMMLSNAVLKRDRIDSLGDNVGHDATSKPAGSLSQ